MTCRTVVVQNWCSLGELRGTAHCWISGTFEESLVENFLSQIQKQNNYTEFSNQHLHYQSHPVALHLLPQLTIIFHFSLLLPCSLPWTYCCPSFGFIFQSLPSPVQVKKFIWKKFTLPRDPKSVPDLFRWFHRQNTGRSFQDQHRSGKINLVLLLHLSVQAKDDQLVYPPISYMQDTCSGKGSSVPIFNGSDVTRY